MTPAPRELPDLVGGLVKSIERSSRELKCRPFVLRLAHEVVPDAPPGPAYVDPEKYTLWLELLTVTLTRFLTPAGMAAVWVVANDDPDGARDRFDDAFLLLIELMTHNQLYDHESDWMAKVALGTSRVDDVLLMFEVNRLRDSVRQRVEARRKGRLRRWLGRLFR